MPSYQDIESRLGQVERKLDLIMRSVQLSAFVGTGVLGVDGKPVGRVQKMSLLDLYYMSQQEGMVPAGPEEAEDGNS